MSRFLTPTLSALAPYTPGEQPRKRTFLKLNTNENPYPPASAVEAAIQGETGRLQRYPDPSCTSLCEAAAKYYGLAPDEIMPGNGSDENLFFALRAFCDEERPLAMADVTYGCYQVWCDLLHIPCHVIPLEEDFSIDPRKYYGLRQTIVIANPNAPTGLALRPEQIEPILRTNSKNVVIIDEAYVDFGAESCVPLIHNYKNLLVVQTFSKSRQLAGARLGLAMGNKDLIADLNRVKFSLNPYNINRMTLAAGVAALESEPYFQETCRQIIETREWTADELARRGFQMTKSKTNFLFVRTGRMDGRTLYLRLRRRGVLVRHFDGERVSDWLRITIGTQDQMETLVQILDEILEGGMKDA